MYIRQRFMSNNYSKTKYDYILIGVFEFPNMELKKSYCLVINGICVFYIFGDDAIYKLR